MHKRMIDSAVISTIRGVVETELSPARIVSVAVEEDVDFDDELILRVNIVFEIEGDRLDPKKVLGLVRHLREPLQAVHVARFPVISFMTPTEADGAAA